MWGSGWTQSSERPPGCSWPEFSSERARDSTASIAASWLRAAIREIDEEDGELRAGFAADDHAFRMDADVRVPDGGRQTCDRSERDTRLRSPADRVRDCSRLGG